MACDALALYVIDPGLGAYRRVGQVGRPRAPRLIPGLPRPCRDSDGAKIQELLKQAINPRVLGAKVATFHSHRRCEHVIGLQYQQTAYTFIYVEADQAYSQENLQTARALIELAFLTFQNRAARNALRANERPIDVTGEAEDFHEDLRRFIVEATGMQLVALRQRGEAGTNEDRNLRCTVVSGWDLPPSEFDLINYSRFPPFERAVVKAAALFSPDPHSDELQVLWEEHPHLGNVESFAVFPIMDDERVIAVLSVASTCRLDFTPTFESVISGIARSVGFTLKNRELHFEKTELQSNAIETAAALNAVELYSDLTHQMGNALATIPEVVETISTTISRGKEIPPKTLLGPAYLGAIEESRDTISTLLTQAAGITSPVNMRLEQVSVSQIWKDAVALVQYRLRKYEIATSYSGEATIDAYPLQLRQVFFHLLLNSIDAFASRSRRHNRKAELHVEPRKGAQGMLRLRYVDNAGGINPGALRQRDRRAPRGELPTVEQAIFLRGVTARQSGSGNGLWIVRQILQRHYGSINLVDYRDGVVFDIEIPTDLRSLVSRRKEM
jgi:signal transduction histidine kinase